MSRRLLQKLCHAQQLSRVMHHDILPQLSRQLCSQSGVASDQSSSSESNSSSGSASAADTIQSVKRNFSIDAFSTAQQLSDVLTPAQRAVLSLKLKEKHAQDQQQQDIDPKYLEELFSHSDTQAPKGVLTRIEFQQALAAHQAINSSSHSREAPSRQALFAIFVASAIPFVAFGFLDNFIMLVAGEEIDAMFGVKFGLSTLASAGLGNLVADVIGVGAAANIEQIVKKLPFINHPKLSKFQAAMSSVKGAKMLGAVCGVAIGCLMGLSPLFYSGNFFTDRAHGHGV